MNAYDGHRLLPPEGVNNYLEFYSRKETDHRLAINNLPRRFGRPLEIPLEINAFINGRALPSDVRLEICDIIGRRVAVLVNESLQTGSYMAVWDASSLSSGVYIARLVTHDGAFIRKMTLIK